MTWSTILLAAAAVLTVAGLIVGLLVRHRVGMRPPQTNRSEIRDRLRRL